MEAITRMSAAALSAALQKGEVSACEAAHAYISRINTVEPDVKAYISVAAEQALSQAEQIDVRRRKGESLPALAGLPVALKDNLCTTWGNTTCASRILHNFVSPYDATAVLKLQQEGCVFLGKANLDEFAMGSSTENSSVKVTRNPRDLACVPGGSSGGSAAAVAADEAVFALGSDTGGSVRQPAAFCGVVGMKPTYGRVSRYGLIAFASSLDQIGPLTKTVEDSALVMEAICGYDAQDSTSVPNLSTGFTAALTADVKGKRIALPRELMGEGIETGVKQAILDAAKKFESMGATVDEVDMPTLAYALPAYYILSSAEASSNLGRFDGVRYGYRAKDCETLEELYLRSRSEGFGAEVKRRILLGTFALSAGYYDAYYKKALQVRTLISRAFNEVFSTHDAVLSPVAPTVAYRIGEKTADPLEMYAGDICTVPVNIAGLPAISMPCGESGGLPVGMQLIGAAFNETALFTLGAAYERECGAYHLKKEAFGGNGHA